MTDIVPPATRSRMMAGIQGKNTKPEVKVRKYLHGMGFRYRLHVRGMAGRPDIVLPKWNAAILVHGCFWHRHPGCRYTTTPATRTEFWQSKFDDNVQRDQRNFSRLQADGWRVAVIWECSLRGSRAAATCQDLVEWLTVRHSPRFETSLTDLVANSTK